MSGIVRADVNEEYALSGYVEAGDFIFLSFCVGNVGESVERQVEGALDNMSERLAMAGLTLDSVVKVDCLLRDAWDIPVMEEVFKGQAEPAHVPHCAGEVQPIRCTCWGLLQGVTVAGPNIALQCAL